MLLVAARFVYGSREGEIEVVCVVISSRCAVLETGLVLPARNMSANTHAPAGGAGSEGTGGPPADAAAAGEDLNHGMLRVVVTIMVLF